MALKVMSLMRQQGPARHQNTTQSALGNPVTCGRHQHIGCEDNGQHRFWSTLAQYVIVWPQSHQQSTTNAVCVGECCAKSMLTLGQMILNVECVTLLDTWSPQPLSERGRTPQQGPSGWLPVALVSVWPVALGVAQ